MSEGANEQATLRVARTQDLARDDLDATLQLCELAFPDQSPELLTGFDGVHFLLAVGGVLASHAAIVERQLESGGNRLRTGYVEYVATRPSQQRRGWASRVMTAVGDHIRSTFALGALGTGINEFFERLGWETWNGPSFFRKAGAWIRVPQADGTIMILRTPSTPVIDLDAPISWAWRPGSAWA